MPRCPGRYVRALTLAGAFAASACSDEHEGVTSASLHPSWRRARVLISDAAVGRLSVIDLEDDAIVQSLPLDSPVELTATQSGTYAFAQSAATVRLVYSGVAVVDHIDHIHIYKYPTELLPFSQSGPALAEHSCLADR